MNNENGIYVKNAKQIAFTDLLADIMTTLGSVSWERLRDSDIRDIEEVTELICSIGKTRSLKPFVGAVIYGTILVHGFDNPEFPNYRDLGRYAECFAGLNTESEALEYLMSYRTFMFVDRIDRFLSRAAQEKNMIGYGAYDLGDTLRMVKQRLGW